MSLPSIAFLASAELWATEAPHLRRRAVALVAEGATATLIEPESDRDPEATQLDNDRPERGLELPRRVRYRPRVPFWLRGDRLERLANRFDRAEPDLVWASGAAAWDLATALARALDRPTVLELRSRHDLRLLPKAIRDDHVVAAVAPCEALARAARGTIPEAMVRAVPLGVPVPDALPELDSDLPAETPVVTILGELADQPTFAAALTGLRVASDRFPGLLAAVEFPRSSDAAGWRLARELGLLPRLTALAGASLASRAMVASDLLVVAESRGGPRCEVLEALGRGVPAIAVSDPLADVLLDAETAVLLGPAEHRAAAWGEAILRSLEHPRQARSLAQRGRSLVWARHRSSVAAAACLGAAQDLLHGSPLRYSPH